MRSPPMAIASVVVKALSTVMTLPFLSTRSARRLMTSADWRDGVVCAAVAVLTPARAVATPGLTAPAPLRKSRREIDRSAISIPLMGAIALLCGHARLQLFEPVLHEIKLGPLQVESSHWGYKLVTASPGAVARQWPHLRH